MGNFFLGLGGLALAISSPLLPFFPLGLALGPLLSFPAWHTTSLSRPPLFSFSSSLSRPPSSPSRPPWSSAQCLAQKIKVLIMAWNLNNSVHLRKTILMQLILSKTEFVWEIYCVLITLLNKRNLQKNASQCTVNSPYYWRGWWLGMVNAGQRRIKDGQVATFRWVV